MGKIVAEDLLFVIQTFWASDVTKLAKVILLDRQFNKVEQLPSPQDIKTLVEHIERAIESLDLDPKSCTPENFRTAVKLVAAKITLYNRRRPGEV